MRLTVFTPTYNREKCLQVIYKSLCNQTNKDFCIKLIENICMFNTTLFEITDTYQVEKIDEKEEEKKIIDEYKEILKQEKENQFKKPNDIF